MKEYKAVFKNVRYEPGTITAVSFDTQGKEISQSSLKTATGKTVLSVTAEKTELAAEKASITKFLFAIGKEIIRQSFLSSGLRR